MEDSPQAMTAALGTAADGQQWTAAASAALGQHAKKLDKYRQIIQMVANQVETNRNALLGVVRSGGQEFQTMRDQLQELMATAAASDQDIRIRME